MKRIKRVFFGAVLAAAVCASAAMAAGQSRITTLLPVKAESDPARGDGMLAVTADDSKPIKSTSKALLVFDLSLIPQEANITRATLRVAGKPGADRNPQAVQIYPESQVESVGYWLASCAPNCSSVFSVSEDGLRDAAAAACKSKDRRLSLTLSSISRLGDWQYYSPSAYEDNSRLKPRLIIEYDLPGAPPDQEERMRTDRTRWKFFPAATEFTVRPIMSHATLISNPVFYKDGLYIFGRPTSEAVYLYGLNASGSERWKRVIRGVVSQVAVTGGGTGYTSPPRSCSRAAEARERRQRP